MRLTLVCATPTTVPTIIVAMALAAEQRRPAAR